MPEPEIPQPQPIPTNFNVQTIAQPGFKGVAIQIASATGMAVYFMPPHVARSLAGLLARGAREAEEAVVPNASGLIVPNVDVSEVLKSLGENGQAN